ncbi:MAG: hypothetical protein EU530_09445 [Promethearchaeota archaeon]|nr:MAG: hypothetical protein EU530_09445 [Candidatus Lokiarchaeota archaeon]
MEQPTQAVGWVSRPNQRCPKDNKISAFKNISKNVIKSLSNFHFPKGRRWVAEDIISILAYSSIRGKSIPHTCEKLNAWAVNNNPDASYEYADGRHRRLVPHQTTVNAWLRLLSLHDAEYLTRTIFEASLKQFFIEDNRSKKVILEFDLTYRGYWGKRRDSLIKGSRMVKGTRRIRHYHAAMIHGAGASLYVALQHVAKGQSKIPFMIETARWLQGLGLEIEFCVIDREYYRQGILDELKQVGIDVIVPAKEWKRLRNAKKEYLNGMKGRTQRYFLIQGGKKGRRAKKTRCWLVLHARGNQRIDEIKRGYKQKLITLDEASSQIYALVTTQAPQYAGSRFPLRTKRTYKKRWQIETSFRDNEQHMAIWRSNYDGTRFISEFGRYFLFNAWQIERTKDPRGHRLTFQLFRDELVDRNFGGIHL